MKTVIIPCCCPKYINGIPSFLFSLNNSKPMLELNLEILNQYTFKNIIIVIDDDLLVEKIKKIASKYNNKIIIHVIKYKTSCVAETIYKTINDLKIQGQIVIKDGDTFTSLNFNEIEGNYVSILNLSEIDEHIVNIKSKSFVRLNRHGHISDIIEKEVTSDVICTGVYAFENVDDFINVYETISNEFYTRRISIYISHIICYLISMYSKMFSTIKSNAYCENNFFLRKEKIALVDFDGTIVDTLEANYLAYREAIFHYTNKQILFVDFKEKCFGHKYTEFLPILLSDLDSCLIEKIHNYKKKVYCNYYNNIRLNNGLVSLLKNIKDTHYLCITSTASKNSIVSILSINGILDLFDDIFSQEDIINPKPNFEIFNFALAKFNVTLDNCIIFEDNPMAEAIINHNSDKKINVITITF